MEIMFIRLFAYANNENNAKLVTNSVLDSIYHNIDKIEYDSCEPYWKINGIYKVEIKVLLKESLTDGQFQFFINDISDKWLLFGSPTDEFLASETTEGCNYIKSGVSLINIFI